MSDNFAAIHQLLWDNLEQYEQAKGSGSADPHQRVLSALEHPYMTLPNRDEFLSALRQELTAEECRAWFAYPDFSYRADPLLPEEAVANADPDLRGNFAALSDSLIRKGYLVRQNSEVDRREYHLVLSEKYRNYMNLLTSYEKTVINRMRERLPQEDLETFDRVLRVMADELMPESDMIKKDKETT